MQRVDRPAPMRLLYDALAKRETQRLGALEVTTHRSMAAQVIGFAT